MNNVFDEEREEWAKLQDEIYRIMRGYIVAYRDIDAKHKTLAVETQFEIPIGSQHTYKGTIDRIYVDEANVAWIQDHKTVRSIPQEKELYLDMQTLLYFDACKYDVKLKNLIGDYKLGGVVFNHIKTKAPREPKLLKSGGLSKAAIDTDIATYFAAVRKHGLNPDDYKDMIDKLKGNIFFKRTKIPVVNKTVEELRAEAEVTLAEISLYTKKYEHLGDDASKYFTRTMLKNRCSWDCEYYPICVAELAGMKTESIIHDQYETREARYDDEDYEEE